MQSVPKVELWLCFNNHSEVALSIPLTECTRFAIRPLKWLRFLGFIIYGRQGYLSVSMNGPELDYTTQTEPRSYYFMSDGEPRFVDVDALDNRTSNTSDISIRRVEFIQNLIERDGTCMLTGASAYNCDACHFIPHSKGDNYMSNLFDYRHEAYDPMDRLDDINDTRNGILLQVSFRRPLDASEIAFLKTPNFALSVDDIPYHQQSAGSPSPANRLTLQHVQPSQIDVVLNFAAPHNSDARQPQDISQWPPAIIVDFCYASAVLRAWGSQTFIKYVRTNSKDSYYRSGIENEGDHEEGASRNPTTQAPHQLTPRTIRYRKQDVYKAYAADPADRPTRDEAFDALTTLWVRAAREYKREREVAGVDENKNKIETWLQSMKESTP